MDDIEKLIQSVQSLRVEVNMLAPKTAATIVQGAGPPMQALADALDKYVQVVTTLKSGRGAQSPTFATAAKAAVEIDKALVKIGTVGAQTFASPNAVTVEIIVPLTRVMSVLPGDPDMPGTDPDEDAVLVDSRKDVLEHIERSIELLRQGKPLKRL